MLGVDAALDGVAAQLDRARQDLVQPLARGDQDLALHQVDAGDHFGHRMLHLDAGVHLDEVQLARRVHQELDRAGVGVAHGLQRGSQAISPMHLRKSGVTAGEGDSSISF